VAHNINEFSERMTAKGLNVTVWISDVQAVLDRQLERPASGDFWTAYRTYDEVTDWLTNLANDHSELVQRIDIGKTFEGRTQWVLKISGKDNGRTKPVFFFDGLIHAREWITAATVTYMTQQLVDDYGVDPDVTAIIDNLDIYVLPIINIDGYEYTWNNNRMWRKTRTINRGSSCIGTDPNRNWDYRWGTIGDSTNPCSDIFRGPTPFSEPCVINEAKFLETLKDNLKGYINFHSYSQLWMTPWGWTTTPPRDVNIQNEMSRKCVAALQPIYGTRYRYGPSSTTIYPASGGADDWTYGALGVVFSSTVELRDTGSYGFLLPPSQIIPSGTETYAALKAFAQELIATHA